MENENPKQKGLLTGARYQDDRFLRLLIQMQELLDRMSREYRHQKAVYLQRLGASPESAEREANRLFVR